MRSVVAIILMQSILLQGLNKSLSLIRYQMNKRYYVEVLCTNKGLMVIDCEGKCRLVKELEDEERRSAGIPGKETIDISSLPSTPYSFPCKQPIPLMRIVTDHAYALLAGWGTSLHKPPRRDSNA